MSYGEDLRGTRIEMGISLRALARRVGISATYLSHIEAGKAQPPSPAKIRRIARELGQCEEDKLELAGKWSEDAVQVVTRRPQVRQLLDLAFGMSEEEVADLVSKIQDRECSAKGGE